MDEQVQALLAAPSTVMVSPGALRWTDESVSAMAVALTAPILSKCWPARVTHNGYEQKWAIDACWRYGWSVDVGRLSAYVIVRWLDWLVVWMECCEFPLSLR